MLKFPDTPEFVSHLTEVLLFASKMGLIGQLLQALQQLDSYGCDPQRPECTTRCEIMADFAPYSFRYVMHRIEHTFDEGVKENFWFNGGLIYQGPESPGGGTSPSLNVSLNTGIGWFSHT